MNHINNILGRPVNYYTSKSYYAINYDKILNYNINYINLKLLNFELLNLSSIIFHDISINDNSELIYDDDYGTMFNFNILDDKIELIIFVECRININTIKKLHKDCHIYFFKCYIISIIGLYNTNITIKIIDTKTDNILDHRFLKSATINNTYIDNSSIILF